MLLTYELNDSLIFFLSLSTFPLSSACPPPPCVCRWIQSLPEAPAHWPLLECFHYRQVLVIGLVSSEALCPAGVQHRPGPGKSPEDRQEDVHPEQTLPQTTSHQSTQREVAHWGTQRENKLNQDCIICNTGVSGGCFLWWFSKALGSHSLSQVGHAGKSEGTLSRKSSALNLAKSQKLYSQGGGKTCQWVHNYSLWAKAWCRHLVLWFQLLFWASGCLCCQQMSYYVTGHSYTLHGIIGPHTLIINVKMCPMCLTNTHMQNQ